MGNTLVTGPADKRINDSLLGKAVSKYLTNHTESYKKDANGKLISRSNNIWRGCCLGTIKKKPNNSQFITVRLPVARSKDRTSSTYNPKCETEGKCLGSEPLGLQIAKNPLNVCPNNLKPGSSACDNFMVNNCGKSLYDRGCFKIETNSSGKKVAVWDAKNKNCFTEDKQLAYGLEECKCINSQTGYTLNTSPSNVIKGGLPFANDFDNPWGVTGTGNNKYTKYSLNIFGYDPQYQYPNVFDSRCAANLTSSSAQSGLTKAYRLPAYRKNVSICLNQINVKDSNIGKANLSNIKQNNNCGGGPPRMAPSNDKSKPVKVNPENKVDKFKADKIQKEANDKAAKAKAALIAKEKAKKKKEEEKEEEKEAANKREQILKDQLAEVKANAAAKIKAAQEAAARKAKEAQDSDAPPADAPPARRGMTAGLPPNFNGLSPNKGQVEEEKKKSKTGLIIGIIAGVVVLIGIIVGVIIFIRSSKGHKEAHGYEHGEYHGEEHGEYHEEYHGEEHGEDNDA